MTKGVLAAWNRHMCSVVFIQLKREDTVIFKRETKRREEMCPKT